MWAFLAKYWWVFIVVPLALGGAFGIYKIYENLKQEIKDSAYNEIYSKLVQQEAKDHAKVIKDLQDVIGKLNQATVDMNAARQQVAGDVRVVREATRGKPTTEIPPNMAAAFDAMRRIEEADHAQ